MCFKLISIPPLKADLLGTVYHHEYDEALMKQELFASFCKLFTKALTQMFCLRNILILMKVQSASLVPYSTYDPYLKVIENLVWKPWGSSEIKLSFFFRYMCYTNYYLVQLYLEINFLAQFFGKQKQISWFSYMNIKKFKDTSDLSTFHFCKMRNLFLSVFQYKERKTEAET